MVIIDKIYKGEVNLGKINPKFILMVGVVFTSLSAIFVKLCDAPPMVIATYRMLFTVSMMVLPVLWKNTGEVKEITKKNFMLCILSGIFLAFHFVTWFMSIGYTSISSATVLVNTQPLFLVVGSYFFLKEKISRKAFSYILITLLGSMIISFGDWNVGSNVLYGDMLALMGALFASGYMIIGRIVRQHLSAQAYTFIVYSSAACTLLLLDVAKGVTLYPYTLKDFILFFALAFFCTILGHTLYNWSLQYLKPTFVGVAILGEPVFATTFAFLIFKEIPTFSTIFGGVIVILGIYLFSNVESKSQGVPAKQFSHEYEIQKQEVAS